MTATNDRDETDLFKVQLSIYIDLYKHHFDMFLKAAVIYLGVVAGLAALSFNAKTFVGKCGLAILVSIATVVGFLGGKIYKEWLISTERVLSDISTKLGILPVDFTQTKKMVNIEQSVSVLLLIGSIANTTILLISRFQ